MDRKIKEHNLPAFTGIPDCSVGIVLGTGLGDLVQQMEIHKVVAYEAIPHLPEPTMEFHEGRLLMGP